MTRTGTPGVFATRIAGGSLSRETHEPRTEGTSVYTLVLLSRGSGALDCGSSRRRVSGPALLLLPGGARTRLQLEPEARGHLVTLCERTVRLARAREPEFGDLFRDPAVLPLDPAGAELASLESTLCGLTRELDLAAATRLTAVDAYLQLLLTSAMRLSGRALAPGQPPGRAAGRRAAQLVHDFLQLTAAHCRDGWRLRDYCRALHVSAGYLRATCVRETGGSPLQLIQECRIRQAKQALLETALPIGAIALQLGFDDPAYFSRLFHVKTGLSPMQYRISFQR